MKQHTKTLCTVDPTIPICLFVFFLAFLAFACSSCSHLVYSPSN